VVARAELDGLRVVELDESEQQAAVIGAVLLGHQSNHLGLDELPAPPGVEQSDPSPLTIAGGDLLSLSHGYLGAVVRRRA
jgi:hypothetical protein